MHALLAELLPQIIAGALLACGILGVLTAEDWRFGATLFVLLVVFMIVHRWDQKWSLPWWTREREQADEVAASGAVDHAVVNFDRQLWRRRARGTGQKYSPIPGGRCPTRSMPRRRRSD